MWSGALFFDWLGFAVHLHGCKTLFFGRKSWISVIRIENQVANSFTLSELTT